MKTEKNAVVVALAKQHPKKNIRYNELILLLSSSPGVSSSQMNFLNRAGFTEANLATVEFELKKTYNIKDFEIRQLQNAEKAESNTPSLLERFLAAILIMDQNLGLKLLIILKFKFEFTDVETRNSVSEEFKAYLSDTEPYDCYLKNNPELDVLIDEATIGDALSAYLKTNVQYPDEFIKEIDLLRLNSTSAQAFLSNEMETPASLSVKKIIELASNEVKTEIKFRDEFPFLTNEDCPVQLKALVTDKFGHYYKFCEDHKELFELVVRPHIEGKKEYETEEQITNDIIFGLAKSVLENFVGDQAIYDELIHYKTTGNILGKHQALKELLPPAENPLKALSASDLAQKKSNLETNIRRAKSNVKTAKDDEIKKKYTEKLTEFEAELVLVKQELDARK